MQAVSLLKIDRVENFFPMLSLSAGLVDLVSISQSHVDIAHLESQSKKQDKKIEGNSFL